MFLKLIILMVMSTSVAIAQDCDEHNVSNTADHLAMHAKGCPNNVDVNTLCSYVDNQLPEGENSRNRFVYQTKIYAASCVLPTDSADVKKTKVNAFWNKFGKNITCKSIGFDVQNGSIVKYAVSRNFDSFIVDVTKNWKVDLNKIDPIDQRTVLDYVHDELEKAKKESSPLAPKLQTYATLLKTAGAKRKADL